MTLGEYYKLNFIVNHKYKWDLDYFDNLIPFEKDIYLSLLQEYLIKEANKISTQ